MSENILSNLNIQFLLSVNEIFRFASVIIIERCELFLGSFKFPSFMFRQSSRIDFSSSGLALLMSSFLKASCVVTFLGKQYSSQCS